MLRADYTEVWCPPAVIPLVSFADRAISISASGIDRLGLVNAPEVLESLRRFDEIYSWYGTNRPEFSAFVAKLPFRFYRSLPPNGDLHAADYYLAQLGKPLGAIPRIPIKAREKENFAILHPFSGGAKKNWPLAQWRELARILDHRMPVRWCCGPEDSLPGATVIEDLGKLAEWIATARVFVGNDSGITHLAAATRTATVALFGRSDPRVWAPRGPNVTVVRDSRMEDITATRVALAVI